MSGLEFPAAVVSFAAIAPPMIAGLRVLWKSYNNAVRAHDNLRSLETDLGMIENVVEYIIQLQERRDPTLVENKALAIAVKRTEENIERLKTALDRLGIKEEEEIRKRHRIRFAWSKSDFNQLASELDRTKSSMLMIKNLVASEVQHKTSIDTNSTVHKINEKIDGVASSVQSTNDINKGFGEQLNRIEGHLSKLSISPKPEPPTTAPPNPRNDSGIGSDMVQSSIETDLYSLPSSSQSSVGSSSQYSFSSPPSLSPSVQPFTGGRRPYGGYPQSAAGPSRAYGRTSRSVSSSSQAVDDEAALLRRFPLLQFKDNTFNFLVACIFCKLCRTESRPCADAAALLRKYPDADAIVAADPEQIKPYFATIGRTEKRTKDLTSFAHGWKKDPPVPTNLRVKRDTLTTQVSHLPQIAKWTVDRWALYARPSYYAQNEMSLAEDAWRDVNPDNALLPYFHHLESQAQAQDQR